MIIRTVKQHGEFAILPKQAINDERLSWEARGVLVYLLEKPDGWQVYQSDLVSRGPAQDHKIRRIMAELEECGYVRRRRVNGNGGKWSWITEIFETPQPVQGELPPQPVGSPSSENHHMVDGQKGVTAQPSRDYPRVDKPRVDKPRVDKPRVENREIQQYPLNQESTKANTDSEQEQQHASQAEPGSEEPAAAAAEEVRAALEEFGVAGTVLDLLIDCSLADVQGWIEYAGTQENLRNPIGFVVRQLRDGRPPPPPSTYEEEDPDSYEALKRRYVPAEYEHIIHY